MRVNDLLALSHVPRWSIVPRYREQSVGDHTFRVLVIATELAVRLGWTLSQGAMLTILHHDADESRSGDIPASLKDKYTLVETAAGDYEMCPWLRGWEVELSATECSLIKIADQIEALTWIRRWGVGPHADRAYLYVKGKIDSLLDEHAIWRSEVNKLIADIEEDMGR